jgi:hypothetical protein
MASYPFLIYSFLLSDVLDSVLSRELPYDFIFINISVRHLDLGFDMAHYLDFVEIWFSIELPNILVNHKIHGFKLTNARAQIRTLFMKR